MARINLRGIGDGDSLAVSIQEHGAELSSIIDQRGRELLWQACPPWSRHAPILFPIIGQMPGGELQHNGVRYPIGQHGFARDQRFVATQASANSAAFTLVDNHETRSQFPFSFRLVVLYTVVDDTLTVVSTITNTDAQSFSASFGEHPAFAWPLIAGVDREAHTIQFAESEPAPIRRISAGLLRPERFTTPVSERTLHLSDSLFVDDAIIFDELISRTVVYTAPGAPEVILRFDDFTQLGVWSKEGAKFVCIEPWSGMTAPQEFSGEYTKKPFQFELSPAAHRSFTYSVAVRETNPI